MPKFRWPICAELQESQKTKNVVDGELGVIGRVNKGKLKEERKLGNVLLCYGSECREEKESLLP